MKKFRAIAIYLPQFHPIPENDQWWGKGFTEWTNVTKAKPIFHGHYQPHLPTELGFYDLRLEESRISQADLARQFGIQGFCYYHYWFNGKLVLERPLEEILKTGKPDFPFMICWANENWTRVWDGESRNVLLKQEYSEKDDIDHINYLIPYLKDSRYIKVDGRPVIAIYKSGLIPDPDKTIAIWRREAIKHNINLYICRFDCHDQVGEKFVTPGFDATIDFAPFGASFRSFQKARWLIRGLSYVLRRFFKVSAVGDRLVNRVSYRKFVDFSVGQPFPAYKSFPGVCPMWDNTARKKKNYFLFKDGKPSDYGYWLKHILRNFKPYSTDENLIFINAWNEWAEGNHLEPCVKWGKEYLEVTRDALAEVNDGK